MKLLYILPALLILSACDQTVQSKQEVAMPLREDHVAKVKWVCGVWTTMSEEGLLTEKWEQVNDSTLEGKTTFIAGGETAFSETTTIQQKGEKLIYTALVTGQNDGKPVDFEMTSTGKDFVVFENPKHDFPQKIRYDLKGTTLTAVVSGKENGKDKKEVFEMEKLEKPE